MYRYLSKIGAVCLNLTTIGAVCLTTIGAVYRYLYRYLSKTEGGVSIYDNYWGSLPVPVPVSVKN